MDRQAFKLRMQQYKTYKELNPDKGYWDWKVQAYDKAGETGLSDEDKRITAAINLKRAEALERSRTRTHGVLPTVNGRPNPLSREQWEQLRVLELNKVKEELDELKGNKHSPLFYNALLTEGDFHPIETREARLKQLEEAVYPLTINGEIGPGCLYTATSNYGGKYGYASNPDFESRPASVTGFKRVPTDSVLPGDIVIRHDDNGGRHAMIFDSKDANGNWLYNHSNGGAEVSDYRHLGKYPSRKDQLRVYRFTGTHQDSINWVKSYRPGGLTGNSVTRQPGMTDEEFREAILASRGNYVAASDNTNVVRPEIVEPIKREYNPYNSPGGHEAVISADTRSDYQVQLDRKRSEYLAKLDEKARKEAEAMKLLAWFGNMLTPSTYIGAVFNDNGLDYWDNVISGEGFGNSAVNFLTDLVTPLVWGKVAKGASLAKGATLATTNGIPMMDAVNTSSKGIGQKLKNKFADSMLNLALNSRGAGLVADIFARPIETVRAIAGKRYLLTNKLRLRYLQDANMAEILERVRRKNVEDLDYRTKLYPTRNPIFNSVKHPTLGGTYSSDEADILFNDDPFFEEYFLEDNSLGVMPSDAPTPFVRGNKYLMSNIAFPVRDLQQVGAHEMLHKMQLFRIPDLEAGMIDPVYGYYKIPDSNVLPTNWTYKKLGRSEIWDPVLFSRLYSQLDQNYAQLSQLKANSSDWWHKRWASSPNEVNSEMMGLRAVDDLPRFGEMTAEQLDKVVDFMADRFYLDKHATRSMLQKLSDAGYKRGGEVTSIPTYKYAGESKDNKDLPDGDITLPADNTRVARPEIMEPLEASYDGKKWSEMTPLEQLNVRVHGHTAGTPTEEGLRTVSPEFEALSWARTLAIMADLGIGKAALSAIKKKSVSGSASKSNFANDMLKQKQQFVQKAINNGLIEAVGGPSEVNNFLATPTSTVKVVPKSGTPTDNYLNWLHDRFNIDPIREGTVAGSYSFPKRVVGGFDTRSGEVWLNAKYPDRIARTLVHEGGSHGTDDAVRNMLVRNVKQSKDELPTWLTEHNADPRVYQVYKRIADIRPDIKTAVRENIKNHKYNPFKLHKINKYSDSSKWYEARATLNETRNDLFDSWWSMINAWPNGSNYNIRSAIIDLQDDPGLVKLMSRMNGYGNDYFRAYNLLSPQKLKEWMDMVRFALKELPVVAPLAAPQLLNWGDQNTTEEIPAYKYAGEIDDNHPGLTNEELVADARRRVSASKAKQTKMSEGAKRNVQKRILDTEHELSLFLNGLNQEALRMMTELQINAAIDSQESLRKEKAYPYLLGAKSLWEALKLGLAGIGIGNGIRQLRNLPVTNIGSTAEIGGIALDTVEGERALTDEKYGEVGENAAQVAAGELARRNYEPFLEVDGLTGKDITPLSKILKYKALMGLGLLGNAYQIYDSARNMFVRRHEEVPAYEYAGETKDDDVTTQQVDNTRVAKPLIVEPIERTYDGRRWSELTPQELLNVLLRGSTSSTPTENGLGPVIKLEDIINMTPLGNIMVLKDMFDSASNNDWLGAGLAALSLLPIVPKGLRRAKSVKRPTPTVNPNYVGDKLEEKFSLLGVDAELRAKFANELYRVVERMMEDPAYLDRAEAVRKLFGDNYPMAYADAFMAYNTDPKSLPRIKVTDDIDSYGSMLRLPDGSYLYSRSKSINQPHNPEHELGHFVDMLKSGTSDAEFGNRMYMQMRKDLRNGIDTYDGYFANPTELKAHMNLLREWMFRNGIITTRGLKVTTGELKKALKQAGNVRGMEGVERASKQFKDIKTYTKWFNTVPLVSVDKNNDNTAIV